MHLTDARSNPTTVLQTHQATAQAGELVSLTIAIPTYNRCRAVEQLIQQLLPQLQPNDELLVVDDGSQDETRAVLAQIPSVRLIVNPSNCGMVKTWNTCLTSASQDWICMIHDDDHIAPTALETIRRACATMNAPALIAHQSIAPHMDQQFRYRVAEPGAWAVLNTTTTPSGVTIHRAIVDDVGGFSEQFPYSCDLEYFARVCVHYPSLVIESPQILHYNQHDQNYQYKTWHQPDFWRQLEAIEETVLQYANLDPAIAAFTFRDRMAAYAWHMLENAARANDPTLLRHVGWLLQRYPYLGRRVRLSAAMAFLFNRLIKL